MNFKKLYPGGEPKVEMPDLFYMQYGNYFALQNLAKQCNINGNGCRIQGCELSAEFNHTTGNITMHISDGYILVRTPDDNDWQLVKVRNVPSLTYHVSFQNPGATVNIRAKIVTTVNPLGTKVFNDSNVRDTMVDYNIELTNPTAYTNNHIAGTTLLGWFSVNYNSDTVTVNYNCKTLEQQIDDLTYSHIATRADSLFGKTVYDEDLSIGDRESTQYKIVSPNTLYKVLGNNFFFTITATSAQSVSIPGEQGSFTDITFAMPAGYSNIKLTSAQIAIGLTSVSHYVNNIYLYNFAGTNTMHVIMALDLETILPQYSTVCIQCTRA